MKCVDKDRFPRPKIPETKPGGCCYKLKSRTVQEKIILFDGNCNLCGWSVRFILKHDHKRQFTYVQLQSEKAKELLSSLRFNPPDADSVIYLENGQLYVKSEAFFRIANSLGGLFKMMTVFRILPRKFTNRIYNLIARNRYKWFGKKECEYHPFKQTQ